MSSIRARLTVTSLVAVAGGLIALAFALYAAVRDVALQEHDAELRARAEALSAIAEREDGGYELNLPAMPGAFAQAWRPDGSVLARTPGLVTDMEMRLGGFDLTLADGRPGRAYGMAFTPREEGRQPPADGPLVLVLAEGIEEVERTGAVVRARFLVLGALALAAIGALTAWTLARALRPLGALTAALAEIDDSRLAVRLPLADQPAELVAPVRTLNELLARLEASFARERQFTANVSHELRTPLAGLRTLLEVSVRSPKPGDAAAALAIVVEMCGLVESLLLLARLDGGQLAIERDDIALAALVDACWAPYQALAAARGVAFRNRIAADAGIASDRDKLRVVVGNLLSNAAEYTDRGGWIEVTTGDGAVLDVTDSGPAIPEAELARVFDRMWRGDAARAATGVHCGIGLSLARGLATQLGLALTARSHGDGRVSFRLTEL
ncbi:MAG TPA: ATP-binding protein [Kofleriaceae bacterium]|nr:ATP-binding protein [Kofleriaceae bacterium]